MSRGFRAIIIGVFLLAGATSSHGELALDRDRGTSSGVAGPIEAVEPERRSIIVDGRRFTLAREVSVDSIEVSAERILRLLSEGDEVMLLDVETSYDQVTRIRTRMH